MLLAITILLIVLVIVAVLFLPIELYFNTETGQYYAKLGALAKASIHPDVTEIISIRLRVFFINFNVFPLKAGIKSKKKGGTPRPTKHHDVKKYSSRMRKAWRVLRACQVKRFLLDVDTGDCILNAKLYPVFALMNHKWGGFRVNYLGRNKLILHLTNRPIYIVKSFINL